MDGRKAQAARNDTAILEAARAVYAADPDAPIAAVATRAGVGISALYRRYSSKEELLRKLCGDGLKEYIAAAEAALADDGDAWKVFRRYMHRIVAADAHTLTARLAAASRRARRGCSATPPRPRTSASASSSARRRAAPCAPTRCRRTWRTCSSSCRRSAARVPKRTAELRKRYLTLQLDGLRPRKKAQPLPGPPPRWKDRASG